MSRLAGNKLVDSENSVAIRSNWVSSMVDFVWKRQNSLMSRAFVLPVESFRATVFPLVYGVKAVASGSVEAIRKLSSKGGGVADGAALLVTGNAEMFVGVSDVVMHLSPFLESLDPALIFEVAINMLYLADVPGGKPEWASGSIIAILTLWDRQEFSSARESIVRAVVTNLHLLDLTMQVSLFKRLLLMVRNLRAESDRMHALAFICRTALCVDLFAKESVRRDVRIKEDLNSVTSKSLFREELVASLVESCFQLSLPLPEQKNSGMENRFFGALAYGTGYGALNWTEPALEVVEVCRPCVKWDCDGRTYAIDCYLKLLVRLCHIYDTRGGVKRVKDGASQDQILNETRLQNLQRELVNDLREVGALVSKLFLAVKDAEHIDLDPLLADDPDDPLNIIVTNIHKVLLNMDSSAMTTNRLQDVQAVLLSAQRLGSRNSRAGQLLSNELEEFQNKGSADPVNKHQCHLILQRIKYATLYPDDSCDPCYVEAYHLADPSDGRITLYLKVINLTDIELNRADIRVGLTGALYFMDGSPQAVRQLRNLVSQDLVPCSITVGASHFERCALWLQVLYYLFYGTGPLHYEGDYAEEDPQIVRQKKSSKPELGEPVILRCQPYKIPLTELLLPHKISPVEYFRLWPSLPAIVECGVHGHIYL
uniref:Uncharacterized protein n=1 Tax=Chenopodium quinoa TaxID=63459 RepID=A0A803LJU3_CHEQI